MLHIASVDLWFSLALWASRFPVQLHLQSPCNVLTLTLGIRFPQNCGTEAGSAACQSDIGPALACSWPACCPESLALPSSHLNCPLGQNKQVV